jgi:inner membrane protein
MSTVVGHALAATLATTVAAGERPPRRRALVAVAIGTALLPDLDIVVFLALRPIGMVPHRGSSHSLLFAIAIATIVTLVAFRPLRLPMARLWCVLALAAASHPLLDYLMGAGPPVQFFAPFFDRGYLFPWRVLPSAFYGKTVAAYGSVTFWALNALAAGLEAVIFLPLIALSSRSSPGRSKALALALTVSGVAMTLRLYQP